MTLKNNDISVQNKANSVFWVYKTIIFKYLHHAKYTSHRTICYSLLKKR